MLSRGCMLQLGVDCYSRYADRDNPHAPLPCCLAGNPCPATVNSSIYLFRIVSMTAKASSWYVARLEAYTLGQDSLPERDSTHLVSDSLKRVADLAVAQTRGCLLSKSSPTLHNDVHPAPYRCLQLVSLLERCTGNRTPAVCIHGLRCKVMAGESAVLRFTCPKSPLTATAALRPPAVHQLVAF